MFLYFILSFSPARFFLFTLPLILFLKQVMYYFSVLSQKKFLLVGSWYTKTVLHYLSFFSLSVFKCYLIFILSILFAFLFAHHDSPNFVISSFSITAVSKYLLIWNILRFYYYWFHKLLSFLILDLKRLQLATIPSFSLKTLVCIFI